MNDRELADEIGGMIFDAIKHGDEKHQAWLHDKSHELGQQIIAALRRSQPEGEPATEAVLEMALTRMDRAREILRGPNANWGMLDTSDLRAALKGKGASQGVLQVPAHMTGIFQQSVATNTTNPARDCASPPDEQKG